MESQSCEAIVGNEVTGVARAGRRTPPAIYERLLRFRIIRARVEARNPDGTRRFPNRELAAAAFGWSRRTQDNIENGTQRLTAKNLDVMIDVLGLLEAERAEWRELAAGTRATGFWWERFSDAEMQPPAKLWAQYEWAAVRLRSYSGTVVPGLLQTHAYTEALAQSRLLPFSGSQLQRFFQIKAERLAVLEEPSPVDYHVIFDEAVLHRVAGTKDVLEEQIGHIAQVAETHENVTVQVVPFAAGLFPAQTSAFTMVDFGIEGDDGLVNIEPGLEASTYADDFEQISFYEQIFRNAAEQVASTGEDTLALLHRAGRPRGSGHGR